jgi:hypothetical protein
MRHEQVLDREGYSEVDVAALWPAQQLVPLPLPDIQARGFAPTPAAADLPAAVGGLLFAAYAALIGAFALATVGSARSIFAVTISALFVVMYFTVPRIFFGVEPKAGRRPSFDRFMREGIQTLTGHSRGRDALVQMLIVPVLLTLGALAMGVAAAIYL